MYLRQVIVVEPYSFVVRETHEPDSGLARRSSFRSLVKLPIVAGKVPGQSIVLPHTERN